MSVVTKRCKDCIYFSMNRHYSNKSCDYIIKTGKRRGCPAGDECDKYTSKKDKDVIECHIGGVI